MAGVLVRMAKGWNSPKFARVVGREYTISEEDAISGVHAESLFPITKEGGEVDGARLEQLQKLALEKFGKRKQRA